MAEQNRLEQGLINLVTNAIDAMDEKSDQYDNKDLEKRLTIKSYVENSQIAVDVSNTGIAVSEEVKSKFLKGTTFKLKFPALTQKRENEQNITY